PAEAAPVAEELIEGGFDPIVVHDALELEGVLATRREVVVGGLDIESDPDDGTVAGSLLHEADRNIPALLLVNPSPLDRLHPSAAGYDNDEYLTRPYSPESIRWRVEAMCIRSVAVDDGSGPVLQGSIENVDWGHRGRLVVVFNPKGGVGKTVVSTNLAA